MKTLLDNDNIVDRLRLATNTKSDAELARLFNLDRSAISTWRRKDMINIKIIMKKIDPKINLHWLLSGKGEKKINYNRELKNSLLVKGEYLSKSEVDIINNIRENKININEFTLVVDLIKLKRKYPFTFEPTIEAFLRLIKNVEHSFYEEKDKNKKMLSKE